MIWLSGVVTYAIMNANNPNLGVMFQPGMGNCGWSEMTAAADNGCFAGTWTEGKWLDWLYSRPYRDRYLFAVVPDVLSDAKATLARSSQYFDIVRRLGYKPAFVAQDGQEQLELPWSRFDALFIGASTSWKLSGYAESLAREAHQRGKWVHVGRVNSLKRMLVLKRWRCVDSMDGTYLRSAPTLNLRRIQHMLRHANNQQLLLA